MEQSFHEGLLEDGVALCWCPGLPVRPQGFSSPAWPFKISPALHFSLPRAEPAGMGLNQAKFGRYF